MNKYNITEIETLARAVWKKEKIGSVEHNMKGKLWCTLLAPPNVTGNLHIGHAFSNTLVDILARYNRMLGKKVLYQGGCDHAGIATQMIVDRNLRLKNIDPVSLSTSELLNYVWEWKENRVNDIYHQLEYLGITLDWSNKRFTMDKDYIKAVSKAFVELYDKGLIYKGKKLVNWDCSLKTAVSDLEVQNRVKEGKLYYIMYPFSDDDKEGLIIATTRPETMFGDVAVAVNNNDERFNKYIGRSLKLPFMDKTILVIGDNEVKTDFGSGCVKITPAHDFNDYEMALRHKLPMIIIMNKDGTLNNNVPVDYQGMDRYVARKKLLNDLKLFGLLIEEKKHSLTIPIGDRSGTVLEPLLTDQWFIKTECLAKNVLHKIEVDKEVELVPENWINELKSWLNNTQDWCISRQIYWGHKLPIWYIKGSDRQEYFVGESKELVYKKYNLAKDVILEQESDVLDTWFSSALWSFVTLNWPDNFQKNKDFHPTAILFMGFDILFFWAARMLMLTYALLGEAPFKRLYIHGLIRDKKGQKMSKSKGNIIDPLDITKGISLEELLNKRASSTNMLIKQQEQVNKEIIANFPNGIPEYGVDCLRFYFALSATGKRNINLNPADLQNSRNFCTKLFNAFKFIKYYIEDFKIDNEDSLNNYEDFLKIASNYDFSFADLWILKELNKSIIKIQVELEKCRFDLAATEYYRFVWNKLCDWYIEIVKFQLINNSKATKVTLIILLNFIIRLGHIFLPFFTEYIWQNYYGMVGRVKYKKCLALTKFPSVSEFNSFNFNIGVVDENDKTFAWLKDLVESIRKLRSYLDIKPNKKVIIKLYVLSNDKRLMFNKIKGYIKVLASVEDFILLDEVPKKIKGIIVMPINYAKFVMIDGIEQDVYSKRINLLIQKRAKLIAVLTAIDGKLNNVNYINNTTADLVESAKKQKLELEKEINILNYILN